VPELELEPGRVPEREPVPEPELEREPERVPELELEPGRVPEREPVLDILGRPTKIVRINPLIP
jgi:hypothetical protein